ncbi:MAG: hypothetical protein GVY36_03850 [Verrucomicrobia bacterium]|nr:hypothetical protein [Verrucomicrobiota bacterium]
MMKIFDILAVALSVLAALLYLYRTFRPGTASQKSCACGKSSCFRPKTQPARK